MRSPGNQQIQTASVVLPCEQLDPTVGFFTGELGFRVDAILPADDPRVVLLSGHGLRIRLERGAGGAPGRLRLTCGDPGAVARGARELTAPNGTVIELAEQVTNLALPPLVPSLVVTRREDADEWKRGRAGMLYRDLIPDRQGGRVIASHIRIPEGGPVPDYVHFHKVRFQMIYCYRGWVRVVYQDQGPAFRLQAGDCVLQPPQIRHRVLECSPGLEVVELGLPAEHETWADHDLLLPTTDAHPERLFDGQRFVRHQLSGATWRPFHLPGFEARDLGFESATSGLAGARVARRTREDARPERRRQHGELLFLFVLDGGVTLSCAARADQRLRAGSACVLPAGLEHGLVESSDDLELLEVSLLNKSVL